MVVVNSDLTPSIHFVQNHFYRPQTKFAKVMFLQVSVCPQGGGGLHPGGFSIGGAPSGQCAGGTHPTGMHSCLTICALRHQLSSTSKS